MYFGISGSLNEWGNGGVNGCWVLRGYQRACGGIYACPASTVFFHLIVIFIK